MPFRFIAFILFAQCVVFLAHAQNAQELIVSIEQKAKEDPRLAARVVDSLRVKGVLPTRDTIFGKTLLRLSKVLSESLQFQSGAKMANLATHLFQGHTPEKIGFTESKVQLGYCLTHMGYFDSAMVVLVDAQKLLASLSPNQLVDERIQCLTNLGIASAQMSSFKKAIGYFSQADSLSAIHDQQNWRLTLLGYIGNLYMMMNNHQEALVYFNKVKRLAIEAGADYDYLVTGNNMGMCFIAQGKYDDALDILAEVRPYALKLRDSTGMSINYENTADALLEKGEYAKATKWLDSAETVLPAEHTVYNSVSIANKRALIHLNQKQYHELLRSAAELKKMAEEVGETQNILAGLNMLQLAYAGLGEFEKAYHYAEKHTTLKDSVTTANFDAQTAEMQAKYKTAAQQREIAKLDAESKLAQQQISIKEANNQLLWVAMIAALLLALFLGYFFVKLRSSKQAIAHKNGELKKSDHEKAVLLKELHHRVKNNLQIVSSLLNMQGESVKDPKALEAFREGQHRVDAMAMIHKHLYSTDELTTVDISTYLERLVQSLAYSYGFNRRNFSLECNITSKPIDVDVAIPLGLIVNELASNAFKHAFVKNEKAHMQLTLLCENGELALELSDDGIGLPADFDLEKTDSFGLELVHTLVKQLKGSIAFHSEEGTHFDLRLQPSKALAA